MHRDLQRLLSGRLLASVVLAGSLLAVSAASVSAQLSPGGGGGSTGGGYSGGGIGGGSTGGNIQGGTGSGSGIVGSSGLRTGTGASRFTCCKSPYPATADFAWSCDLPPTDDEVVGVVAVRCDDTCGGGAAGGENLQIIPPNAGGGCATCGGGSSSSGGTGALFETQFSGARDFIPNNRSVVTSYGPGMAGRYDSKLALFPGASGGGEIVFFDAMTGRTRTLVDGVNGDALDGVYQDLQNLSVKSLELRTASGSPATSMVSAATAKITHWDGKAVQFGVMNLGNATTAVYAGRLTSIADANGHTLSVTYRDSLPATGGGFTTQQLTQSPDRRWQIHRVTDWQGDVATYNYSPTQVSGRWAVSSIAAPNNVTINYTYTNGNLTSVATNGVVHTTYTYGQDPVAQTATVVMRSLDTGKPLTIHLTNDYMTLTVSGQAQVINQPQGILRMTVNATNEVESMLVPSQTQAGLVYLYEGTGKVSEIISGQYTRYWTDGWQAVLQAGPTADGGPATGTLEGAYIQVQNATSTNLYQGTIPQVTDETGRQYTFQYDASGKMTRKTFVADGTFESYSYSDLKKLTRLKDRQGNVVKFEYDSRGNMTKSQSGLKEVNGQDVAQPEFTQRQWDYYPAGHYAAGLLKTEYDANWDGSSTDTNRTDYEYNARGNVTKRLGPAPAPGAARPETNWTYDANDRVASTSDTSGHTVTYQYDSMGRKISTTFDDQSTEQTLYGTIANAQDKLVLKTKDRRNVVTSYTYDGSGRVTQVVTGSAYDANILDGQADDTPITDRNQKSITSYIYLAGTELPVSVIRDGSVTDVTYDYRQRAISTKVYPYAGKMLESKKVYVDNKLFSEEDPYGRKKFYGYRASDGQLIRYVSGAYPSFSLADQAAVFALTRSTALNPDYTVKDAITDQNGRPETVIDERGTISKTIYDAAGRVTQQIAAFGTAIEAKTETIYDDAGNAIEVRSPRYFDSNDVNGYQKCRTVMTYDGAGRVLSRTEAPGTPEAATESYTYDAEGRQVTRTDARGKVWTTTYASCCGHTVASKNPLGHGSITNQNAGGLTVHTAGIADVDSHSSLLNPTDNKTLQETTTRFDALGRSIASTVWLQPLGLVDVSNPPIAGFGGVAGTQGLTTQTLYDADLTDNSGLETTTGITVTNPLGGTYTVSLAAAITKLGEPIAQGGAGITFAAGTPGSAVVNINAENEISFSISDAQGRSLISGILHPHDAVAPNTPGALLTWSCQVPDTTETINSKVYLTSLSVDALGNTTKSRSNALGHTVQSVDQAGNISTVQYDAVGNAIVSRDPNNVGQDCVYDALGRQTQCTDTVGSVTKTGYDKSGQQISATDAKNKTTYYVFDARGRRRRETDRLNYPTEWGYDAAGNLLSLKDAENQITSYGYNDAGQRITEQYPDHVAGATIGQAGYGIITFSYDALGRRVSKQDQQGDVTSYNFDMSGRMLTRGYVGHASGPLAGQTNTDTFTYDREGRMLSGIKGRYSNTVTFSYDDRGQQTQETLTTHGQTYTVGYVKNMLGQTTRLVYPDGSLVDRAYTNRGQLQAVNYTPLNGALSSVATFTYDAGGRETARNLGNGLTTTRSYFADNQIQSIETPTVETLTYTYDANKNPTSETRSGVMAPYSWTTGPTGYDDEDRLTNWSRTNGDSQTWNLSPVHDWNSTTINGSVQTRTHGPAHELLTMSGAQVTSSPRTLTHDTKGDMTTDNRGCGMTWDFDNMLQNFAANGVTDLKNATYEYDAIGRRVAKNVAQTGGGTETTLFVLIGQQVACEYTPGNTVTNCDRKYAYGSYIDEVLNFIDATAATEARYWLSQNRQYSVYATTIAAGTVMELYRYDAYGKVLCINANGSLQGTIPAAGLCVAFTGRVLDKESQLYFFRMRMFSGTIGRFLGIDQSGYTDGLSLFCGYFAPAALDPTGTMISQVPPGGAISVRMGKCNADDDKFCQDKCEKKKCSEKHFGNGKQRWNKGKCSGPVKIIVTKTSTVELEHRIFECECDLQLDPPGDCPAAVYETLRDLVEKSCKNPSIPECDGSMSAQQLRDTRDKHRECYSARSNLDRICFRGGDRRHIKARMWHTSASKECSKLLDQKFGPPSR